MDQAGLTQDAFLSNLTHEHIFKDDVPFPESHASTIISLDNGSYMLAWFAGTHEKHDDVGIWMSKGQPGNWSEPFLVVKVNEEPHWNPVLFKAPDERIYLYFKVGKEIDYWGTWVLQSVDFGHTWSSPRELVPGDKGAGPGKKSTHNSIR
jgi:predicted neuraminidase